MSHPVRAWLPALRSLPRSASDIQGYLPALLGLTAAIVLHYGFLKLLDQNFAGIFFVYLMAILVAAWCGYGPGIVVVALVVAAVPFLFQPNFSLSKINAG